MIHLPKQGPDLGTAHEEENIGVRDAEGLADPLPRAAAILVDPVAGGLLQIRLHQAADDGRMGSFCVIALE